MLLSHDQQGVMVFEAPTAKKLNESVTAFLEERDDNYRRTAVSAVVSVEQTHACHTSYTLTLVWKNLR